MEGTRVRGIGNMQDHNVFESDGGSGDKKIMDSKIFRKTSSQLLIDIAWQGLESEITYTFPDYKTRISPMLNFL